MIRKIIFWGSAIALVSGLFWASLDTLQKHEKKLKDLAAIEKLRAAVPLPVDFHGQVDAVRNFIWSHSKHDIDADFKSHWGNTPLIVEKMMAHAAGARAVPPSLECSARSGLMEQALSSLGYRVRSVNVYKHDSAFYSHTFLEVLNPQTKTWEAQDPDYNIFWADKTGKRIGIQEIIKAGPDNVMPCLAPGNCGWNVMAADGRGIGRKRDFFGMAVIIDRTAGTRDLFANKALFPLDAPVTRPDGTRMTYCAYRAKDCRGEITVY